MQTSLTSSQSIVAKASLIHANLVLILATITKLMI